jgi:hypothetical protein
MEAVNTDIPAKTPIHTPTKPPRQYYQQEKQGLENKHYSKSANSELWNLPNHPSETRNCS